MGSSTEKNCKNEAMINTIPWGGKNDTFDFALVFSIFEIWKRLPSKDKIFDIVFGGIIFKMRQLLIDSQMAQNQNDKKNVMFIFVPLSFFYASLLCSA